MKVNTQNCKNKQLHKEFSEISDVRDHVAYRDRMSYEDPRCNILLVRASLIKIYVDIRRKKKKKESLLIVKKNFYLK